MTEDGWLASSDPQSMLEGVFQRGPSETLSLRLLLLPLHVALAVRREESNSD
jgi:hypothetical protein